AVRTHGACPGHLPSPLPTTMACSHPCWLWPRRDTKEEHLTQRPDMVSEPRRHRRRTGPPLRRRAAAAGRVGMGQGPAYALMGQKELVVTVEHGQLLPQPVFALAQRADPSPDRGHMLTDGEIEPVTVGRRVTPSTTAPKRRMKLSPHAAP